MPYFANPHADESFLPTRPGPEAFRFHRSLPDYAPTPLRELTRLPALTGASRIWLKDEGDRLGLPSFKILGASWAICSTLAEQLGDAALADDLPRLRSRLAGAPALFAATDGNHGRAVARTAALLGLPARIFLPAGAAAARLAAIALEGAAVEEIDGTYDQTVQQAAEAARSAGGLLVQDTGWLGYAEMPQRIVEGYSTLSSELAAQLAELHFPPPDLILVQVGIGALAQAIAEFWTSAQAPARPRIVGVEPRSAACLLAALEQNRPVTLPGRPSSLMAGLVCGTVSEPAWPTLRSALDGVVTVEDARAEQAVRALADEGVVAGETGAAGAAGLLELAACGALADVARTTLPRVLLFSTEGATDPASWRRIVAGGRREL